MGLKLGVGLRDGLQGFVKVIVRLGGLRVKVMLGVQVVVTDWVAVFDSGEGVTSRVRVDSENVRDPGLMDPVLGVSEILGLMPDREAEGLKVRDGERVVAVGVGGEGEGVRLRRAVKEGLPVAVGVVVPPGVGLGVQVPLWLWVTDQVKVKLKVSRSLLVGVWLSVTVLLDSEAGDKVRVTVGESVTGTVSV